MSEELDTLFYKLRFFIVGLLIVASLLLLSAIGTASMSGAAQAQQPVGGSASTSRAVRYDSPNAVTSGMVEFGAEIGQVTSTVGRMANGTVQTIALASAQTGRFIGYGLRNCATFAANIAVNSVTFVIKAPGKIIGGVANTAVVSAIIKPADDASHVPIIEPYPISLAAATAATMPTIQKSAAQPVQAAGSAAAWPIHGDITTLFGVPHWPYQPTHTGIDISSGRSSGVTPVKPFKPGKVVDTVRSYSGLGNHVVVDHGGGVTSVYAHLSSMAVQIGQDIDKATVLGYEGSTGASTGTHLHFEIRLNGQSVDPRQYISGQPQ